MSMQDPISDLLTRIRNAQMVGKREVHIPDSNIKRAIVGVLKEEGYITDWSQQQGQAKPTITVNLKYFEGKPVIENLERISRPALRIYKGKDKIPTVEGGLGVAIISTSKGVMSDRQARKMGLGGEVLCYVS